MHVAPQPSHVIVDIGCGTGSLALLLSRPEPSARIIGLDPDPEVLVVAQRKAFADVGADATVQWCVGMGDALLDSLGADSVDTVVSSLVLHRCPMPMKRAVLASMLAVLKPGGRVVIADYGLQRTTLMGLGFRIVQLAAASATTGPLPTPPSRVAVVSRLASAPTAFPAGREPARAGAAVRARPSRPGSAATH
jgi:ubiquinone/menaquinone biosynthesis C-methylase UbiE